MASRWHPSAIPHLGETELDRVWEQGAEVNIWNQETPIITQNFRILQ
jgi:hypothetical protein